MNSLLERTERYLCELNSGSQEPRLEHVNSLPLVLRERYQLYSLRMFGQEWLLAIEAEGWEPGTPAEYQQHIDQIAREAGKPRVALVASSMLPVVRNRMVQLNVPFVIPAKQIFLPLSMINLKESHGAAFPIEGSLLSPAAQLILLVQLNKGCLAELSSLEIADMLKYSTASISLACSELESKGLCKLLRKGRELRIVFIEDSKEAWKKALPLLRSPVQKKYWINWQHPDKEARLAGISALSSRTNLADDALPTFALLGRTFQERLERGELQGCADKYDANAQIEKWRYDPALITEDSCVDPFSLYLSLRVNPDERVQGELERMMEEIKWQ